MKPTMKAVFIIMMSLMAFPVMAQTTKDPVVKKETKNAKVIVEKGKTKLILKSGIEKNSFSNYSHDIEIVVESNTWRMMDSVISAPFGNPVRIKDAYGYNVAVARANVNEKRCLMISSGTKCISITQDELNELKN